MSSAGIKTNAGGTAGVLTFGGSDVVTWDGTGITGGIASVNGGQVAGLRNKVINGGFDVWQRGTSFASDQYCADRFNFQYMSGTVSKYTFVTGSSISGRVPQYGVRWNKTSTSASASYFYQKIEGISQFSGKTVTVSFVAGTGGGTKDCTVSLYKRYGSSGSSPDPITGQTVTLTSSFQLFSVTFSIPSNTGKTISGGDDCLELRFSFDTATHDVYFSMIQLEEGSVATPFEQRPYGMELALCQRYYYRAFPAVVDGVFASGGQCYSTSVVLGGSKFPVSMRVAPSALEQSGTANQYAVIHAATATQCTSVPTFQRASVNDWMVSFTTGATLTAGRGACLITDATNGASAYLGWSAEL